ncbi:MAG: hypothetical protein F4Y38_12420 [Gemmatimonadetes bacterium]|nr:hypothetical protein [Gemmatimonadota bacterium]MYG85435.1 hypothetical protein [Gemmatimonadota bacterium]MYJ88812.1 hypothetical protein [Gemmatimonadota bacterium]
MVKRLRVAAVCTIYFPGAHADVIVSKFLKGWSVDEGYFAPEVDVVSLYIDHVLENDIGLRLAEKFGVPVYPSIRRALHAGGDSLGVDAVLLIGEHGDYPWNERGRHMYPRRYFFEQIAGVFAESGRSVPVFSDKHLAYDFRDAQWMWSRAEELDIPLMAGSSLPLAWRDPWIEYDLETNVEEALTVGFGGIESYGYHTLEALQCMVERRIGGETGVASVQCLEGDAMWRACEEGLWSRDLMESALDAIPGKPEGSARDHAKEPAAFLVERRDGLRTTTLMLGGYIETWAYAARVDGRVHGAVFNLVREGNHAHFGYLCANIQRFFQTGAAPYPPERTLLVTGIVDAVMNSRHEDHRPIETPWLDVAYNSYTEMPCRPVASQPEGGSVDPEAPDITGRV